jgi:hypothetical protein
LVTCQTGEWLIWRLALRRRSLPGGCHRDNRACATGSRSATAPVGVVKTTVYLPDVDRQALKAAAQRRHQSEAELIREGIRRVLADEAGPVMPDFGLLDAAPVTAADIDATLSAGLGAAGIER